MAKVLTFNLTRNPKPLTRTRTRTRTLALTLTKVLATQLSAHKAETEAAEDR